MLTHAWSNYRLLHKTEDPSNGCSSRVLKTVYIAQRCSCFLPARRWSGCPSLRAGVRHRDFFSNERNIAANFINEKFRGFVTKIGLCLKEWCCILSMEGIGKESCGASNRKSSCVHLQIHAILGQRDTNYKSITPPTEEPSRAQFKSTEEKAGNSAYVAST